MQIRDKCRQGRWARWSAGLAAWLLLEASTVWAHRDGYLRWAGPPPLRFLSSSKQDVSGVWPNDNDITPLNEQTQTNPPAVSSPLAANADPVLAPVPKAAPGPTNTPAPLQSPVEPSPPATAAPTPTNPAPAYEFVLPDPLPGSSSLSSTPAVTNTIGPASEMLFVTPQMLVDFFKPIPGVTNTAPVRVLVPVDIGFQPPLVQPAPPSRAIYRSP